MIIGIQKQPAVNTLELTERIDATLDDIQQALPQGMQIQRDLFRQADFIEQSLDNLFKAFLEGAALVIIVVVVFLMNLRAAAITLLALPLSLVAAAIAMDRFGLTINSMSLGGLAIAIGELVDDAIIDVENVVRRLRDNAARSESQRQPVLEVVYHASTEIRQSVVFATVIVALVFLPLFMLSSVEGRLLRPLGFGYVVALTASLVVALTVTPVLCSWLLPTSRLIASGSEPKLTQRLKTTYERWLAHAFTYWRTVLAAAAALLIAAVIGIVAAGRSFLPEFNEGALTVSAVTIPGTSLADSNALGNALERLMLSVPEVTSTARRTGRAELDEHVQGVESAEIDVRLEMKDRPREEVLEELRQKVSLLPGTNVTIGQPISHRIDHMLSGTRANIAVKIFGDDLPTLRQLASQVQAQMSQVAGVVDLATEAQTDIPTLKVRVDPAAAARQGLASGARGRSAADGARRPRGRSDSSRSDRVSISGPLRAGRRDHARVDRQHADPDAGPPSDSAVSGRADSGGPRAELRDARERPAPDRRPEQRVGPGPAQCRQRHPGIASARTSGCRRDTTSSTAGNSRAKRRRRDSCCGCRWGS